MSDWFAFCLALFLLAMNALLVAAEFSFVRSRVSQLETLRRAGSMRAGVALGLVRRLDSTLATTQVGITLANLGIGWVGEPAVAALVGPFARGLGAGTYVHPVSFVFAFMGITLITVVLGELVPRAVGIQRSETIALLAGTPIRVLRTALYPLVALTNACASAILKVLGIAPLSVADTAHTEEELRTILALSHDRGHLSRVGRDILDRALGFSRLTARQLMVPRPDVVWLSTTRTIAENIERARASGYTRFPVCDADLDRVVGIVHIKDLLAPGLSVSLSALIRTPIVVPETATADRLLRVFQKRTLHLAIVVDEYGGTSGIVTLEDVLEEIVGELQDEFDEEPPAIAPSADGTLSLSGSARLAAIARALKAEDQVVDASVDTVAGFVQERLGRLAREGDRVPFGEYMLRVDQVRRNRIVQLTAIRERPTEPPEAPAA